MSPRASSKRKWLLAIAAVLVAIPLLLAAAIYLLVDINDYRGPIEKRLESVLHRDVTLGDLHLSLFPIGAKVDGITVEEIPELRPDKPFLAAREVRVAVALWPLLRRRIEVDALRILEPRLELIRLENGQWNVPLGGGGDGSPGVPPVALVNELDLVNGTLAVTNRQEGTPREVYQGIDLRLRGFGFDRPFDARVAFRMPDDDAVAFELRATFHREPGRLEIMDYRAGFGKAEFHGSGFIDTGATPAGLDLTVQGDDVPVADLMRLAAATGVGANAGIAFRGALDASVKIAGTVGKPSLTGTLTASDVEASASGWRQPVRVSNLALELTPRRIASKPFVAEAGSTRMNASFALDDYIEQPVLHASLSAGGAKLDDLLHMAAAYGAAAAAGIEGTGAASLQLNVDGPLDSLRYSGQGSIENGSLKTPVLVEPLGIRQTRLRFDGDAAIIESATLALAGSAITGNARVRNFAQPRVEFALDVDRIDGALWQKAFQSPPAAASTAGADNRGPVQKATGGGQLRIGKLSYGDAVLDDVNARCRLDRGIVHLDPVAARMFGGSHLGSIRIDTRPEPSTYSLSSRIEKVDANRLLSSTTSLKELLYGMVFASSDLRLTPEPGRGLANGLNGAFQLSLEEGRLAGVSIMNQLAQVAQLLGVPQTEQASTRIVKLAGGFQIRDGVANTDDLKLEIDGASLAANGRIGLVDEKLDLRVTAVLSRETAARYGGSKIGGWMTTALGNRNGELVIPCLVTGTASKPSFAPDAQMFARLKIEQVLPTMGSILGAIESGRKGALGGVLGAITGARPPSGEAAPEPETGEPQPPSSVKPEPRKPGIGGAILDILNSRKKAPPEAATPVKPPM